MKMKYCLILFLIGFSACRNSGRTTILGQEKKANKESSELSKLLSPKSDSLSVSHPKGTDEIDVLVDISKQIVVDYNRDCKKCDIETTLKTKQQMKSLDDQMIFDFLCTFNTECSINIEYSEFSNDILFKVLSSYPESVVRILSKGATLDKEYIYKEIATPLLDYDTIQ